MRARCACGALGLKTAAEPLVAIACHCLDCQRRTGAPFGAGVYYPREAVAVSGEPTEYGRPTDSGGVMRTSFCPRCGTSLFWTLDTRPGLIGVAVGAIEDPRPTISVHSVWERSKLDWVALDAVQHHPRGRPRPG